jgi:hypothetical protein
LPTASPDNMSAKLLPITPSMPDSVSFPAPPVACAVARSAVTAAVAEA